MSPSNFARVLPIILTFPVTAIADQYHYSNVLVGVRAAGMGGAYSAISDDPAGLYYNPAGIVYSSGSSISGSMNALHTTSSTYKKTLDDRLDWERSSATLIPNFFGVFQPFGKGHIGFSYAVTDAVLEDQDQTFYNVTPSVTEYTVNFNNQDMTYNLGPTYAQSLSDTLSIGITLYGHIRTQDLTFNQLVYGIYDSGGVPTTDVEWINRYNEFDEYGVRPVFGLMWSPRDQVSFGLTLSRTVVLSSKQTFQASCRGADNPAVVYAPVDVCENGEVTITTSESTLKSTYPLRTSLGMAYFPTSRLALSSDLVHYGSTQDGKQSVINLAVGAEYYLNAQWALRAGFYTNNSNTPNITNGSTNQAEHVDLRGLSASLTHFSRNSALTAGITYSAGDGKAQLFADDPRIQNVAMQALTFYVAALYSY